MYEYSIRFHLLTSLYLYKYCEVYIILVLQYNLKLRIMITSGVYYYAIIFRVVLAMIGFFMSPYESENYHFYICEEWFWKFDEDYIKSVDCFWKYGHFCYTDPTDPRVYNLFPSSDFFSNYVFSDFNFLSYKFFTYLARTIPSILCYLKLL